MSIRQNIMCARTLLNALLVAISLLCSANVFAAAGVVNTTLRASGTPTVTPATTGASAQYTFACEIKNRSGANILLNGLVTYTFPAGTNAATVNNSTSTFQGIPIPTGNYVTINASTISFRAPIAVSTNAIFVAVFNGITNPTLPSTPTAPYRASVSAINASTGLNSGENIFSYQVSLGGAAKLAFAAQPTSTASGAPIVPALQILIQDGLGNTVSSGARATDNITLSIGNNPAGGTLSGTTTVAAIAGVATFTDLKIDRAGTGYTLVASDSSFTLPTPTVTSSAFNISASAAARLVFSAQPGNSAAGETITPGTGVKVEIRDANGNLVGSATDNVTLSIVANPGGGTLSGTTTVAAVGGVATFSTLSIDKVGSGYVLAAFAAGLLGSNSTLFNISAGTGTKLVFMTQPSDTFAGLQGDLVYDNPIVPSVQVVVQDAYGNLVNSAAAITITVGNNPGGGTLTQNPASINAVSGVATFSTLNINKVGTGYTLVASSGGLAGATSSGFTILPEAPAQLAFLQQPSNTQAAASIFPAVKVAVQDFAGNTSPCTDTIVISKVQVGGTLSGDLSVDAIDGLALFGDLSLDVANTYNLSVSDTTATLGPLSSDAFVIDPSTSNHLSFLVPPVDTIAGSPIAPVVQVAVKDASNNTVVADNSTSITLGIGNNAGGALAALSGTVTVTVSAGVATFNGISINKAGAGYTLRAVDDAVTVSSATSPTFNITPAALDHFLIEAAGGGNIGAQSAAAPFSVRLTAQDANNNTVTSFSAAVQITSSGTLSGTPVTTAVFTAGVLASQALTITSVQLNTTLTATGGGQSGTSNVFAVGTGVLDHFLIEAAGGGSLGSQSAGSAFNIRVTAQDSGNNTVTSFTGMVQLTANATLTGSPMITGAFTGGVFASQALTITSTQAVTRITATGYGKNGTSNSFAVTPGVAATLAFSVQPTHTAYGAVISPAPIVTAYDAYGNVASAASLVVTLAIGTNPSSGTLSGTASSNSAGGVASFVGLSIGQPGAGYTLVAACGALPITTSASFNIVDAISPTISSGLAANPAQGTVAVPISFSVAASDAQALSYTWNFGDGSALVSSVSGTYSHTFGAAGLYTITVTVTDLGGLSTTSSLSLTVSALTTLPLPSTHICEGLNPVPLGLQQVGLKLSFTSADKDSLSFQTSIILNDGFNPMGQEMVWQLGDVLGRVTLNEKGSSPTSTTIKASVKYKKPAKGESFTARPAKISISLKSQNLGNSLKLKGISTLNADSASATGDLTEMQCCLVFTGHQAYEGTPVPGPYKAKLGKGGAFKGKIQ